jgi:hypothetical protein
MIRSKGKNKEKKSSGEGGGGMFGGMFKKKDTKSKNDDGGDDDDVDAAATAAAATKNSKARKSQKGQTKSTKASGDGGGNKKDPKKSSAKNGAKKKKNGSAAPAAIPQAADDADSTGEKTADQEAEIPAAFRNADPTKWRLRKYKFNGSARADEMGREEIVENSSIAKGVQMFKENPGKYKAMLYQTSHLDRPESRQKYNLVHRMGTEHYRPVGVNPNGWMTLIVYDYIRLPPFKKNDFPMEWRDPWTDHMSYQGRLLHSETNKPIMPGRGMGILDKPHLKIIGDVDPSDIYQGTVSSFFQSYSISSVDTASIQLTDE